MRMKRSVLARFVRVTGVSEVGEITNEVVNRWTRYLAERGARATSVNVYNSVVVGLVRYYREMGVLVPINLALVVKMKGEQEERRYYTAEEVSAVVEGALAVGDEVVALQITMMFETGMRIAELVGLRMGDFGGYDGRRVRFVGKGRRLREVYVTVTTREWVTRYMERHGISGDGFLWSYASMNGEPPTVNTVRLRLQRAFSRAGFSGFYPHALRHSFATDLQRRGASVVEIKEMIGHSSVATTERYLHGMDGKMRELFERYR